jgi:Protein of unknown function (DUF2721)
LNDSVLHAVQLAVAPVFMLAAVAGMIGTVATRLARIVDRARILEERLEAGTAKEPKDLRWELDRLRLRGRVCNASVALLAICGMAIGATVMALFIGETSLPRTERAVPTLFLGAVGAFVVALLLFLAETLLATHTLRFKKHLNQAYRSNAPSG